MQHSAESIVSQSRQQGVRGTIVVGAGFLYGRGGGATPQFLLRDARQRQSAWYIGDGTQRWSAIHVDDLARLVVLALEHPNPPYVLNAVADAPTLRETAEWIAQTTQASLGTQSINHSQAEQVWGPFWGRTLAQNLWLSSEHARQMLGWQPQGISLQDDLLQGSYVQP